MEALLPIVVAFVLTGLISNRLLQTWQARAWLLQQRFLGQEKDYVALKELADEIATLLGIRIFHMQRLNRALASATDEQVDAKFLEYDGALKRWNERLTSFYIRLPLLTQYELALRLENSIQVELVNTGAAIEDLVKARKNGASISKRQVGGIENQLNAIQGRAISFNKHLLGVVKSRRVDVYYGQRFQFSLANLKHFSTWQLVKALFIRDIDSLSVGRASLDS